MPIVNVTPLGSSASDIGAAIGQIIDYLQRGSKTPQPNMSPTVAYYADSAEGPGIWRGRGVAGLQLHGPVDPEVLREILAGHHPHTGEQVVQATGSSGRAQRDRPTLDVALTGPPDEMLTTAQVAALAGTSERYIRKLATDPAHPALDATDDVGSGERPRLLGVQLETGAWSFRRADVEQFVATRQEPRVVVAYDVTLSVEKSISLAWVHADPDQRAAIEQAIDAGVNAAVSYLEEHALHVRRGRTSEQADGVWAASYRHLTNRHLEPQLHEHILIANVAAPVAGGDTQAIDARHLMHHGKTAGYVAGAVIRHELSSLLGVGWEPAERGLADIARVPRTAIDAMSTRRKEVESVAAELGLDSRNARQYAALSTRAAKQHPADWDALEAAWSERLDAHGFARADWLQLTTPTPPNIAALTDDESGELLAWLDSPEGVTRRYGIFTRRDVVQHVIDFDAQHGSNRLTLEAIETLTDRYLASTTVLPVNVPAAQMARYGETRWYTNAATLQLETDVIVAYRQGLDRLDAATSAATVDAAITAWEADTGHRFGADQRQMVHHLATSKDRYSIVVGPAGTGKTAALEVAARMWESVGLQPLGVSVTGAAADQLGAATGIPTRTVASLLASLEHGNRPLGPHTVLVVDEASTLSNRDHHALLRAVERAGARMVTIGDPAQHSAVDAGGLWAHLVTTLADRVAHLHTDRRQAAETMTEVRLANSDYRNGRIAAALKRLHDDERIVTAPTAAQLLDELATDWYLDHQQHLNHGGPPSRMMAEHHTVRRQLNERAQALLLADGTLTGPGVRIAEATFHVGDQVVTRTRDHKLRLDNHRTLRNGSHGTITDITTDPDGRPSITVDFNGHGTLTLDHEYLTRPIRPGVTGGLAPAYAVTTHVAQGSTMTTGRMIASDTSTRAGIYVSLTRGTRDTRLYAVRRRDLEPPERSDIGLPTITDTRTTTTALADQLAKPDPATIALATTPNLPAIQAASTLRLPELRHLATTNPDARHALDLVAQRIATRHLTSPPPSITDRIGERPTIDSPHRPTWDAAAHELSAHLTRHGTEHPPVMSTTAASEPGAIALARAEEIHQRRTEVRSLAQVLSTARSTLPIDDTTIAGITSTLDRHSRTAVEQPAGYLTDLLGQPPTTDRGRLSHTWTTAATEIERWRHQHGLTPFDTGISTSNRFQRAVGVLPVDVADDLRFQPVQEAVRTHLDGPDQHIERTLRR